MRPSDSLQSILGLSDSLTQAFLRLDIESVADLLLQLPIRYEDRTQLYTLDMIKQPMMAYIYGQVIGQKVTYGKNKMLIAQIQDTQGDIFSVKYFRYYPSQLKQFAFGNKGLFYGKVSISAYGYEMAHPEITWLKENDQPKLRPYLYPIYRIAKGLTQKKYHEALERILSLLAPLTNDPFTDQGYLPFQTAMMQLHQPDKGADISYLMDETHPARQRLIMEELLAHRLSIWGKRQALQRLPAFKLANHGDLLNRFLNKLPFTLTHAQQKVFAEISADMGQSKAMLRLVQGDVGSGKTIVALLTCLQAISNNKQAVFMVPTELLAQQHYQKIKQLLSDFDVTIVLYASKLATAEKREKLEMIADGRAQLIIGTHALFQAKVNYCQLVLAVIDEQHRFGVQQRISLQDKAVSGYSLHQLVLTATPIPRTLAMSAYGELDTSIIDALPAGRKAIKTAVINNQRRDEIIQRVGQRCRDKEQTYWVCPLIEESEVLECENAEQIANYIQAQLIDIKVGLVHGRLDSKQRQRVMEAFVDGELDLLVATTVIEVGVDVANASMMVIENAERFGLAQLHQLRGRVGRGNQQSYCLLLYQHPLGKVAQQRLQIMRESNDGFLIAEEDLKIRGAGELLGTKQTGDLNFKVADIERDILALEAIDKAMDDWQKADKAFTDSIIERWIGDKSRYYQV